MSSEAYWVGSREGSAGLWLYDPSVVHDNPKMIYLFRADDGVMAAHSRNVRNYLSTVTDHRRGTAIDRYLRWYQQHGAGFVVADRERKEREVEERRKKSIERHQEYLKEHGKQYSGVIEGSTKKHRTTHCYSCKDSLDSSLHLECKSCSWLICYCGACGCGYQKWL